MDIIALKIRHLITKKEGVIANANRETAMEGWTVNWDSYLNDLDTEIDVLFKALARLKELKP
jgi:hypothetical protein